MFTIIGADGKEYGPVSIEQVRQWINEGRVNLQTRIRPLGTTEWRTVADFPELLPSDTPGAVPGATPGVFPAAPVTSSASAMAAVSGPATGLMVVGGLTILGAVVGALRVMGGAAMMQTTGNPQLDRAVALLGGVVGILFAVAIGVVILMGATKMKRLENYGFAMAASILAMLPCSACCLIGLPIGIWSLVVLSKPEVKSAFH